MLIFRSIHILQNNRKYDMSWKTDLTKGIEEYFREFEDADKHVENISIMRRPRVRKEYDDALKKLAEAKLAVSAFVGVYDDESRK
jgi:hypothetical protein